jgi:hypothetical protein
MANAAVNAASLGDNTLVAAVAGKRIRVHAYELSSAGVVTAKFKDGAATDLTGPLTLAAAGAAADAAERTNDSDGLFQTTAGNALVLNLSAAIVVGGFIDYTLD